MQSAEPQGEPVPSGPSGPEITPVAPKRKFPRIFLILIIVAIIVIAGLGAFAFVYLGTGSILVTSNNQFVAAGGSTTFSATVTPPAFVTKTGLEWNFGDGQKQTTTTDTAPHTYSTPGNYFVLATATLSNGKVTDNSQGLFPVQVGTAPVPNAASDEPNVTSDHSYANGGIFLATLQVTTGNFSNTQTNRTPVWQPVATGETQTTTVGMTVPVGSYHPLTYSGNVIKPGIITNMEAVTGGYTSLDPALDYESTGFEVIANVYEELIQYNGTSTSEFVPVIADQIPSVANGQITPDFLNYPFHIRQGLKFSNGDPVTPLDVKYSITRTMLMNSGSPFPPGWIISQFFIPGQFIAGITTAAETYSLVNDAITVNDTAQTVRFHLIAPAPPLLFFQVMADPLGGAIVDHLWLESTGPKLTWTPSGFVDYENYSFLKNYVPAWGNGAMGSGPFMIVYAANPDAVVLKPNPLFQVLPGVQAATVSKVVLQYVADAATRELSLESGQADIAGIPADHFPVAQRLAGLGLARIQFNPTLNMFWWNFNLEIYQSAVGSTANPYGNQVPPDFFVDLNMRKAFAYAYNYGQYIDQILGNKKFGATFGTPFNGIIPNGMSVTRICRR